MKTAIQELIEELNERFEVISGLTQNRFTEGSLAYLNTAKKIATDLLEKEKQQIVDAYKMGGYNYDLDKGRPQPIAEDYYTQNFNPTQD